MRLFRCILALLAMGWAFSAQAQVSFAARYSANTKGDIVFVSNTSMTCPAGSSGCTAAQTNSLSGGTNNNFNMVYVDIDADTNTFNSSSAQLNLTGGSSVMWAGLYWAGDSSSNALNKVKLKGPSDAGYVVRTASQVNAIGSTYQSFLDITSIVAAQGSGNYTVADIQSTLGANRYAGWTIVVAYQNPALPMRNLSVYDGYQRVNSGTSGGGINIALSGFLTPPIGPVNTRVGTIAYDGDRGSVEGTAGLQFGQTASTLSPVFNALNPQTDYFNSTISRDGAEVSTRNPAYLNTFGYDADISQPNTPLPNGATTAVVRVSSSSETIDLGVVTLVNDIFVPNIKDTLIKKVTDINGGLVLPGDILEYEISFGNNGQDPALEVVLRDNIPANTAYIAGSLQIVSGANSGLKTDASGDDQAEFDAANNRVVIRAGVGANGTQGGKVTPGDASTVARFRVRINNGVPGDTQIDNFAVVTFKAQTLGTIFNDTSDADSSTPGDQPARMIVASPDLTITKTHIGNFFAGQNNVTYSLVISNAGAISTSGNVTVTEAPPAGLSSVSLVGVGWNCVGLVCTRSDVLPAGQSYPPLVMTANVDLGAAASIVNQASVSGGAEGASKTGNNTATDPTTIIQGFPVSKSFTPTLVSTGQTAVLRITVDNLSSVGNITGLSVNDPLPAGLVVANPPAASAVGCGLLSFAPIAGATVLNSSGGTITPSSSCTLVVSVVAASAGAYANSIPAGSITTLNAGNSKAAANATLSVAAPDLQISKQASGSFFRGQTSGASFAITVSNTGSGTTTGAVTVVDDLPLGLLPTSASGAGWNCSIAGQQVTCSRADGLLLGNAYPAITIAVSVDANAPTSMINTAVVSGGGEPLANATGNSASAPVSVLVPATATKIFSPSVISLGGTSLLQITVSNSNAQAITGLAVIDAYPANLLNSVTPTAATTCAGGTLLAAANGSSVQLTGATLAANQSCVISVVVTPSPAGGVGGYVNALPAGAVTSSNAGSSTAAASATLNLSAPDLTISKSHVGSFSPGQSTASFSIVVANNGSAGNGATLGQINMVDILPAGLVPAAASGAGWGPGSGVCSIAGQTVTCNRSDVLAYGASFPPIVITVNVTDAASGTVTNVATVSGGSEPAANANNNSASDAVFVLARPLVSKSFSPGSAALGVALQMSVVITNPNSVAITGVSFTDNYPAGLANTASPAAASTCGGSPAAAASGASLSISNATIAANSVCTVTVNVQANVAGDLINAISAGGLISANAGSNNAAANATLRAAGADLVLSKTHTGNFFQGQTTAVFVITATNQGAGATVGTIQVSDVLPAGLTPLAAGGAGWGPQAGNQCTVAGQNVTCETNAVLAPGASSAFSITVSVASNAPATLVNQAQVIGGNEPLSSQNNNSASDTVLIYSSPRATKAFSPAAASAGQTVTLTVTLFNDNPGALSGVSFTDNLPAGLLTAGAASNNCGGLPVVSSSLLSLSGGSVPANGACQISVPVVAALAGSYINTIPAGAVGSNEAGSSQQNAQATLAVAAADLQVSKSHVGNFYQGQSPVTYTVLVSNAGAGNTDGTPVVMADDLPIGLTPINASGVGWACGFSAQTITCSRSGVFASGAVSPIIVLASVDANAPSSVINTARVSGGGEPVSSAGNNSASDPTTILANPVVSKAFTPSTVNINQASVMTIRITNPNAQALSGVAFNDSYPSGLVNASAVGLTNTCGGSPVTTADSLALSAGLVPPNAFCEISVQVQAATSGGYTNSLGAGSVATANAGSNPQAAQATLNVAGPDLSITKSHLGNFYKNQTGAQFTISVRNIGLGATAGAVTVSDTLPGTMAATAMSGAGWSCGLSPLQCTRSDSLPAGNAYPDIIVTVNVSDSAASTESNRAEVSGGGEPAANLANNVAADSVLILGNPSISKSFTPASINANNPSDLVLTLSNPNAVAITGVSVTDNLPVGLNTAAAATGNCGGSLITSAASVSLTGASIPANGSCQVRVQVTGAAPGSYANVIAAGALSSANAGSNQTAATANLSIAAPDLILAKSHTGDFYVGQNPAIYNLEVRNIGAGATNGSAIVITDTLPAGLSYQGFSGSGWACSASLQVVSCSNSAVLQVGGSLPALVINVSVLSTAAAQVANTASVGGGGEPASNAGNNSVTDSTKVLRNPQVSKTFSPSSGNINVPTRLSITLSNSNDVPITSASFTDTYPAGLVNASPANAVSTCGGSAVAAAGGNTLALSGGTIPSNGTCQVEVSVVVSSAGNYTNTLPAGAVSSGNAGSSTTAVTAFFAAQSPDLAISKQHAQNFFQGQVGGTFTLGVTNVGVSSSSGTVTVTDVVPAGMTLVSMSGTNWTCAGNTCTRTDALISGASYEDILVTVNIASTAPSSLINSASVSNANEPSANLANNTANDTVQIYTNPTAVKSFSPANMLAGDVSVLRIVLANANPVAANSAAFTDNMPAAISVASPANAVSSCGGTVVAAASSVSLSGGTIPANGSCEVRVNVTANLPGAHLNTLAAGALSTINTGVNQTPTSAALTIASPDLILAKSHVGNFFQGQNNVTFTLAVTNIGLDASSGPIFVTDTFPAGLTPVSASGGINWVCSVSGQVVACSQAAVAGAGSALPAISVVANVATNANNTTNTAVVGGGGEAPALASNNTAQDSVLVLTPIQVSKAFSPSLIVSGQTTNLIISLSNLNISGGIIVVNLTDNMPAQITVAGAPVSTCSGAIVTATLGSSVILVGNAGVNTQATCAITVPVTASAPGAWANVINPGDVTPNTAAPAVASLVVNAPNLSISKSHTGNFFAGQQGAAFAITVDNIGNAATNGSMVAVTDTLPTGLTPVSASGTGWSCNAPIGQQISCTRTGSPTAVLAASASFAPINVIVNVDANTSGNLINSAQVSGGGEVDTSNNTVTDAVLVLRHLGIGKQFSSPAINPNQTTTLTVRLINSNPVAVTGVGFTDTFPTAPGQMIVNGATATGCPAGTVQALPGNGGIVASGITVPANASCTVTAVITAATSGLYVNQIPASQLSSDNAGTAAQDAQDALTVEAADLISKKSAVNAPFFPGQTDALFSVIVQNVGNAPAVSGIVSVIDNLPAGLQPTAAAGTGWSCSVAGDSVSCSRDAAALSLAVGASYPVISITTTIALSANGTLSNTAIVSGGGDNNPANNTGSVDFEILRSPVVSKSFAPSSAQVSQTVQLTIALVNPNSVALTGAAVTDTLPSGLSLNADPAPVNTCGGTLLAPANGSVVSLSGGTIPSGGCFIRVNVMAANPGVYLNVIPAGQLQTANAGTSQQAATASLQISAPDLRVSKKSSGKFWRGQQAGAAYVISVSNIGSAPSNGTVTMQDTIPSGLAIGTVTAVGWSCATSGQVVSCARADSLPVGGNYDDIQVAVTVARDAPLSLVNTARISGGGEPPSALANNSVDDITTILANPVVSKQFLPANMSLGQIATLEITVQNSNPVAITNVAVTDAYPPGLINAPAPNASSSCGGTLSAAAGSASADLANGTIAANSNCVIKVDVTTALNATPTGLVNTILAGSVTSANAGDNPVGAAATLNVASSDLVIVKRHIGDFYQGQANATYTLALTNQGSGNSFGTVTVTDTLPASMTATAITAPGWSCNALPSAVVSCSRNDVLTAGSSWPLIEITVQVSRTAVSAVNFANVSGGGESAAASTNNGTSDPTTILVNPTISKAFSTSSVPINTPFTLTLVLSNGNAVAVTGVAVSDVFPAGLAFAATPNTQNTCAGTVATTGNTLGLTGGSIPANGSCSLEVAVIVTSTGSAVVNTLPPGALISANAGSNPQTVTASVTGFVTEPTGYKSVRLVSDADISGNVSAGDTLEWTIIYANTQNGAISRSGFQINDSLPAGLTLTAAPSVIVSGSGTLASANTGYNGSSTVALLSSGAVLDAGGIITVNIPVRIVPNIEGVMSNQAVASAPSLATPTLSDAADNTMPAASLPPGVVIPSSSLLVTKTSGLDATVINVSVPARIGVAKSVNSVQQISGTTIRVVYDVLIKNFGPLAAPNVQALDNLLLTYPAPVSIAVVTAPFVVSGAAMATNASFNGNLDIRLLQGNTALAANATSLIRFAVNVSLSGGQSNFPNSVFASTLGSTNSGGTVAAPSSPGGLPVFTPLAGAVSTDASNSAAQGATAAQLEAAVDPSNNSRPNDAGEDNPTNVSLAFAAALRGSVWFDTTSNRTRDAGEAGVANFGVELINSVTQQLISCVPGVNSAIGCITMPDGRSLFATNANGDYEVIGVPVATYIVRFRDGANNVIYGNPTNTGNPLSTLTTSRDGLSVTLNAGVTVAAQSLPLDPSGVVYNSSPTSRAPISGAVVTFCGPPAFNAATQLVGGASYTPVPGRPNCAAMTVGALGFYQYLLQPGSPAGQYTLSAAAPSFFGPSVAIPPAGAPPVVPPAPGLFAVQPQSVPPTGAQATTYYLALNLSGGIQDVVHNHIPLDPLSNARLFVTKSANQRSAEIGDSVEYTISVVSPDTSINGVSVTDRLPTGFRLIPRTVRINGVSAADPAGAPGPQVTFSVGTIAQNVPARISYRVRLGVGSQIGDGINRASANATGGINSNVAQAVVKVTGGVFTNEGCIVGKIFVDCNRNHTQDAGEPGIPGVRLYLEDGTYLISDRDGKYSYCGLSNSTHVLKVDQRTLPKDSRLTTFSNRNVGDAESVLIDMRSGELYRADFVEGSCKPEILEEVDKRRGRAQPLSGSPESNTNTLGGQK
jgi:mucin-19